MYSVVIWRWVALASIVVNIAFNAFYPFVTNAPRVDVVSARYPTLLTPAGYAFSIWGVIYLALLVYGVHQVLPSQKYNGRYTALAFPITVINLLLSLWIYAFTFQHFAASVGIIVATLGCCVLCYRLCSSGVASIPVRLLMPWLCVATAANISIWLVSMDVDGRPLGAHVYASVVLSLLGVLSLLFALRLRDALFPIIVGWATFAVYIARDRTEVAFVALAVSVLSVLAAVWSVPVLRRNRAQGR